MGRLGEVAAYFLRLGTIGFGGPPAHIAAMHDDLVRRREWIDERHFLDVLGVTNLIPGPNSTEVAIHIGYLRAGVGGGIAAGLAFILPAFAMVLALSWAYLELGGFEVRDDLLAGVQAVALAAVLVAAWRLRAGMVGGWRKPVLALAGLGLTLAYPELSPLVLLAAGVASLVASSLAGRVASAIGVPAILAVIASGPGVGLGALAWVCLRTGLLLFGGGLVLVPLLAPEVVGRGWLTEAEFLDGVALGQATPGPITMTATFVGFAVRGWVGAVVATVAIFLPSFVAVLAGSGPFLRRFRERPAVTAFVEGVTAAALGAILAAVADLARTGLAGWVRVAIFASVLVAILFRVPVALVVLAGALLGMAAGALGLT
ncbi:MAG: chromate efflux transporter [Actinomycetota bacterium]